MVRRLYLQMGWMMTGTKLAVAVLSFATFLGTNQLQRSIGCYVCNNPSMLYLMAQYKMAVGDTAAGVRLLKQASVPVQTEQKSPAAPQVNAASKRCPLSSRT